MRLTRGKEQRNWQAPAPLWFRRLCVSGAGALLSPAIRLLDDALADSVEHDVGGAVEIQLGHQPAAVCFYRV